MAYFVLGGGTACVLIFGQFCVPGSGWDYMLTCINYAGSSVPVVSVIYYGDYMRDFLCDAVEVLECALNFGAGLGGEP